MKFRLCVDVDSNGHTLMASVEVAPEMWDSPVRIWAAQPGPFDTPEDVLRQCQAWVLDTYGQPMRLFD